METIKLTKEQSEVLEKMRVCHHLRNDKEALLLKHASGWMNAYKTLNEIPMLGFAQLVLNDFSYEIEPEQPKFQPGDKLYSPIIGILNVISCSGSIVSVKEFSYPLPADEYRHATPEEIYWLETLKRDSVNDYRTGDVMVTEDYETFVRGKEMTTRSLNFIGIYPAESFKSFSQK